MFDFGFFLDFFLVLFFRLLFDFGFFLDFFLVLFFRLWYTLRLWDAIWRPAAQTYLYTRPGEGFGCPNTRLQIRGSERFN